MATLNNFKTLNEQELATVEGGIPAGWYSPFASISNNIICRVGYHYSATSMNSGNCRVDWGNIVGNVGNNIGASFGDMHNPLP